MPYILDIEYLLHMECEQMAEGTEELPGRAVDGEAIWGGGHTQSQVSGDGALSHAMAWMFVSSPNSYVGILKPKVMMVLGGGTFGGD